MTGKAPDAVILPAPAPVLDAAELYMTLKGFITVVMGVFAGSNQQGRTQPGQNGLPLSFRADASAVPKKLSPPDPKKNILDGKRLTFIPFACKPRRMPVSQPSLCRRWRSGPGDFYD
jgi:hypothetical protein